MADYFCFFPVVLLSAHAQSAKFADPKWRFTAELPRIHATTTLRMPNQN